MTETIQARLDKAGIILPSAAAPAANYVPVVRYGNILQTSGQLPIENGAVAVTGKVGSDVSLEEGQYAAKLCAINILAQAKAELGDLEKIGRLLKLTVFVASDPAFTDQHQVANGASNFLVEILGEKGKHARSAVGVIGLPRGAAVEVEAFFEIV